MVPISSLNALLGAAIGGGIGAAVDALIVKRALVYDWRSVVVGSKILPCRRFTTLEGLKSRRLHRIGGYHWEGVYGHARQAVR